MAGSLPNPWICYNTSVNANNILSLLYMESPPFSLDVIPYFNAIRPKIKESGQASVNLSRRINQALLLAEYGRKKDRPSLL